MNYEIIGSTDWIFDLVSLLLSILNSKIDSHDGFDCLIVVGNDSNTTSLIIYDCF